MPWNEQLEKLLIEKKLESSRKVSVMDKEITGVVSVISEPESLFYTDFSEEAARSFCRIFSEFKNYYEANPFKAPEKLKQNLMAQMEAMGDVCPIEAMLFSSRIIKDYIKKNNNLNRMMIQLIQKYLPYNLKAVKYILSGWEWPNLLRIVIEACGETNDEDVIDLAIQCSDHLIDKFVDEYDHEIFKSYIKMVEVAQNERYLDFLVSLASSSKFESDVEMQDFFITELHRNTFFMPHNSELAERISIKISNNVFRNKLSRLLIIKKPKVAIRGDLTSSLSTQHKINALKNLKFGMQSEDCIKECERVNYNDTEVINFMCQKIMESLPLIRPESVKSRAIILLGTKGQYGSKKEIISFLYSELKRDKTFQVPIYIALSELSDVTFPELFSIMFSDTYQDKWLQAIGAYFRYKRPLFENLFMNSISAEISRTIGKDANIDILKLFYNILEAYNGYGNNLSGKTKVQDSTINIISLYLSDKHTEKIYDLLLLILDTLIVSCPESVREFLDVLDVLKEDMQSTKISSYLIKKADIMIEKGDKAREPD